MDATLQGLHEIGLVPVIKINDSTRAVPLAQALVAGGLPCAEVTFRTSAAAESIRAISEACPEVIVGAGTVLTTTQVDEAVAAGARFIVSPGFNPEVVDYCLARGILVMPGISDASGVEQCLARGLTVVKFFPAEDAGGLSYIKALSGPYADVRFMPTGGINLQNLASYITCPSIFACGATWMVKENLIDEGRFDEVVALCREAVQAMLGLRLERVCVPAGSGEESARAAQLLSGLFGSSVQASVFGGAIELLEGSPEGTRGELVISSIDLDRAVARCAMAGIALDDDSAQRDAGKFASIKLSDAIGGFAIRLVRRS